MKKEILTIILSAATCVAVFAGTDCNECSTCPRNNYELRLGYNVGGTMPLDMPASIRGLNRYDIKANLQVGADYERQFSKNFGLEVGLKLERKAMGIDATVKGYDMSIAQGDEIVAGVFTGNVVSESWLLQAAVPLQVTYHPSDKVKLKVGPYIAYAFDKGFSGYAYDGYLREGDPTGPRTELGSTTEERGNYDFCDDVRPVNWGVDLGVDWYLAHKFGLYADLTWGLSKIFPDDFQTIRQKMYPIYGTVGFVFKISK